MEKKNISQDINISITSQFHTLPVLPLKNIVVLPKSIIPIVVGRQFSIEAVEHAFCDNKTIFIAGQKNSLIEIPSIDDIFHYGTRATILQLMHMPKGPLKILVEGISRSKIHSSEPLKGFLVAHCHDLVTQPLTLDIEIEALWRHLQTLYASYAQLEPKAPVDLVNAAKSLEDIEAVADTLLVHVNISFEDRQSFLEMINLKDRILRLCTIFKKEITILKTEESIREQVKHQIDKNHREYYLTEQIKAIYKELGKEDRVAETNQLHETIKSLKLPKEVFDKARREIYRLEQMPSLSSEAVVTKNYLDWIIALPWNKITNDVMSIESAEALLNKKHAGLKKIKDRILEFVATKKFSQNQPQTSPVIICLVGPPGVGKTSLAASIAQTLGRKFASIAVGGMRDEAMIRGHLRAYVAAEPGAIIQAMRRAGSSNPVILIDEIDKMTSDAHGDPTAALLEVFDPIQNKSFSDRFLEVGFDLSKVIFIATANNPENIPYPLLDRMELINIPGYTEQEKLHIAQSFLIPKNLKLHNLKPSLCRINQSIILTLINHYTKEAGVRQLERLIAKLMRKSIQILLKEKNTKKVIVSDEQIRSWLGSPRYKMTPLDTEKQNKIGVATGLAWTELGGDILEIETSIVPGKGAIVLTGQLGDVMQESAHAAFTYIKAQAKQFGLPLQCSATKDIHIHVPEGATPKDGPSAGITICTALVSAFTKIPIHNHVAMTGEITLNGRILPIGGLKEKILAAKRNKCSTIIIPYENNDDLEEIKSEIADNSLQYILVKNIEEVLRAALVSDPFRLKITKKRTIKKNSASKT